MRVIVLIAALLAAAAIAMGLYGGTDLGETPATVRWSALEMHRKSGEWFSNIRAELPDGKLVQFTAAHTPPQKPGERIVLRVRKTNLGWHSYTWQVGKMPAM